MHRYGPADGRYTVVEVGETVDQWPTIVVRFGDKTAVLQLCGVGTDTGDSSDIGDNGDHLTSTRSSATSSPGRACSAWRTAGGTRRSATPRRPVPPTAGPPSRASASWTVPKPPATPTDNQHVRRLARTVTTGPNAPNQTDPRPAAVGHHRNTHNDGSDNGVPARPGPTSRHRRCSLRRLPVATPAPAGRPGGVPAAALFDLPSPVSTATPHGTPAYVRFTARTPPYESSNRPRPLSPTFVNRSGTRPVAPCLVSTPERSPS